MPEIDIAMPHDKDLEEAVLASLLTNKALLANIGGILNEKAFYFQQHRYVCRAMIVLFNQDKPVDLLTVSMQLTKMGKLEDIGGAYSLTNLASKASGLMGTAFHYHILMELALRREMILAARQLINKAADLSRDAFDTQKWILNRLSDVQQWVEEKGAVRSRDAALDTITLLENPEGEKRFFPIGDKGIDNVLGTAPGNLVNISGKSGAGKTTFTSFWARELLKKYHTEVALCWYSMEDEASKLIMGFVSAELRLTYDELMGKNHALSPQDKSRIEQAIKTFSGYDVEFFERAEHVNGIKNHFRRFCLQRPGKFNILIIDNISKLRDYQVHRFKAISSEIDDHIATELYDLFTTLKKDFRVSLWFLHHLGKEQLSRSHLMEGYRPREDSIKGSTSLRDIATQGILINRPGEFEDVLRHYKDTVYYEPLQKLVICQVFKNRNGQVGFLRYFADLGLKIFYPW